MQEPQNERSALGALLLFKATDAAARTSATVISATAMDGTRTVVSPPDPLPLRAWLLTITGQSR